VWRWAGKTGAYQQQQQQQAVMHTTLTGWLAGWLQPDAL